MKKLEKLGSKLFDAFRGDEVSELASVVGGYSTQTFPNNRPPDTWIQDTTIGADGQTAGTSDIVLSDFSCDGMAFFEVADPNFGNPEFVYGNVLEFVDRGAVPDGIVCHIVTTV